MSEAEQGPLQIGSQFLEKYEVRALVGRGGFAWVYHGYDPFMDEHVAIKIIHRQGGEGVTKDVLMRGRTEARTLKKANHPNIVKFFDAGMRGTSLYIVMELLPGRALHHVLKDVGRLTVDEALSLFAQIADGIAAAHELGAIHRDIKPANIFVTAENIPKVLDFGIAKAVNSAVTTRSQGVLGTIAYISPEQLNGVRATAQSDMYSFGIMLYEALGYHPCHQDIADGNVEAVGWFHATRLPPRLDQINPEIPEYLALFVHRLIAKIPDQRFRSMKQVAEQLRAIQRRYRDEAGARLEPQRDLSGTVAPPSTRSSEEIAAPPERPGPNRPSVVRSPVPVTLMGLSPVPRNAELAVPAARVAAPAAAARQLYDAPHAAPAAVRAATPVHGVVEPLPQAVVEPSVPAERPALPMARVEPPSDSALPRTAPLRPLPEEQHQVVTPPRMGAAASEHVPTPATSLTTSVLANGPRSEPVSAAKGPSLLQVLVATVIGGVLLGVGLIFLSLHRDATTAPAADSAAAAARAIPSDAPREPVPPLSAEPSAVPVRVTAAAQSAIASPAPSAPAAAAPPIAAARAPRAVSTAEPVTPRSSGTVDAKTVDRMEQSLRQLEEELRREKAAKTAAGHASSAKE